MKKIVITQRILDHGNLKEECDALAAGWIRLLRGRNCALFPLPNHADVRPWLELLNPDGVILTGGNDIAALNAEPSNKLRDKVESELVDFAAAGDLPLFAVCRGMQFLAAHFGGTVSPVDGHVNARHALKVQNPSRYFAPVAKGREVNSYHRYAVSVLPTGFSGLLTAPDGTWEAMEHESRPWLAQMWHPERELATDPSDLAALAALFGI